MTLSTLLSSLGIAPKTLPQAHDLLAPAKAQLDSVAALFAAAGLPLEEMLAAGPESLKAHLASLDQSETIASLNATNILLADKAHAANTELQAINLQVSGLKSQLSEFIAIASVLGIAPTDAPPAPDAIAAAFRSHTERAAAALLAKDGRPPVAHVAQGTDDKKPAAALTDAEHLAKYESLPEQSRERATYGATHYDAIRRAYSAQARE